MPTPKAAPAATEYKLNVQSALTRRLLLAALVLLCARPAFGQGASMAVVVNSSKPVSAGATWTVVQHPNNVTCSFSGSGAHTCAVTSSATTAGNLLILLSSAFNNNGEPTFSSASGDGTWTHCPGAAAGNNTVSTSWLVTDCAYRLSATGGATSESFTWTISLGTTELDVDVELIEVHRSTGTATYDSDNTATSSSCSSCVGPTVTLSTSSDYIAQWGAFDNATPTSISSPYSNPFDNNDTGNVFGAFAGALNQSSGAGPTWTVASGPGAFSGVALPQDCLQYARTQVNAKKILVSKPQVR